MLGVWDAWETGKATFIASSLQTWDSQCGKLPTFRKNVQKISGGYIYQMPTMLLMQVFFEIIFHSYAPEHIHYKAYEESDNSSVKQYEIKWIFMGVKQFKFFLFILSCQHSLLIAYFFSCSPSIFPLPFSLNLCL